MKTEIRIRTVKDFNQEMRQSYPGQIQMLFKNVRTGEDLKHGYVLSVGKSHRLYKTQRQAQIALITKRF